MRALKFILTEMRMRSYLKTSSNKNFSENFLYYIHAFSLLFEKERNVSCFFNE